MCLLCGVPAHDVTLAAADLARMRADLEAEKVRRKERGDDLTEILAKLAELRTRMEPLQKSDGLENR